ncbi:hypothetical protein MGL_0441 [Malassezia globosa CBS 7966]|uniref:Eukaryotic translation initiation factor 3 subunit L n=1 Tax=Malassezia globosa (strain ATCC MYA-4612 / CBS 7966) TaxID=425265 RepID=A8PTK9_MALGO|nr:uncharacterized protein MGL_0441 [Malassezia globosa CBS 7966]EDP45452.1 hypothetical protein MGL_0441 [Malassezia globosa CBS 7966]
MSVPVMQQDSKPSSYDERPTSAQVQRPVFAGEEEEFIDDELGDDVDLGVERYTPYSATQQDEYAISDSMHETAQGVALNQQPQQHAASLSTVPEQVRKYLTHFQMAIAKNSLADIHSAYETHWNRLSDRFYQRSEWPDAETIAPLVGEDPTFLLLYRELWGRHMYARLIPESEDRVHLYDNYCEFFNYVLNSDGPVSLELPVQWLWDIIDEFIYQYQAYSHWRNKVSHKQEHDIQILQDNSVWNSYSVLNVLYSLIQKSNIMEQLKASNMGQDPDEVAGEFGVRPLYKMLGYFSIIGLLRVHVLMGDYTLALKTLDHININKKSGFLNRVTACHITAYYYVGFSYMMMRRYPDAIRAFTHILVFITRLRQYHTRSYQYDSINKMVDHSMQHQLRIFLQDVKTQLSNVHIRSFLRVYTSLGTDKLAGFLDVDEEEVVEMMMVLKNSTRSLKWTTGGLLEGEVINTSDLGFVIDTDMVNITESRISRKYGDWFVRNAGRISNVLATTKRKPLPVTNSSGSLN